MGVPTKNITAPIESQRLSYLNKTGRKIIAYYDSLAGTEIEPYIVVVLPKYGETKKNNLQLAFTMAANGLHVLRFDHTCHVGESEGAMTDFTLPGAVDDVLTTLDFVQEHFGVKKVVLVSSSLSSRSALRAAALDSRIRKLVCLVGVFNVSYTLREVYREDLVANHIDGKTWGVADILGHEIDFDNFLRELVKANMHDLQGTIYDLSRTSASAAYFGAENDPWVDREEVALALGRRRDSEVHLVAGAMHEVRENQEKGVEVYDDIVRACFLEGRPEDSVILRPEKKPLLRQNKIERDYLRKAKEKDFEPETDFWGSYLEKYSLLDRVDDYRRYLDTVGDLLGRIDGGDIVLDAGCGNGLFGVWLIRDVLSRNGQGAGYQGPPVYVGLDLTCKGLSDAMMQHCDAQKPSNGHGALLPDFIYGCMDLDVFSDPENKGELAVEFGENTFDKVCCSLLISYLKEPQRLIDKLYKILKPGGTLVVSSMKPFCDMSMIYRDFMDQKVSAGELEMGRDLLRAAGKIKIKEELGYYVFFSGEEMSAMADDAGFRRIEFRECFGGQAHVVKAEK